jgi:hypothetical protein
MKLEVDKLGEHLILEREAMYEDLGLNLKKVCERGGTAEERGTQSSGSQGRKRGYLFTVGFCGGMGRCSYLL